MLSWPIRRSLLSGTAGFMAYGGWAYLVNSSHDEELARMIGLVQGCYSFVLTLTMTLISEWLYGRWANSSGQMFYVVATVCGVLFIIPLGIHAMMGTPEIVTTILPGFVVGSIYTWVYLMGLRAAERNGPGQTGGMS